MSKPYILCVDDEATILMSLKAQLKRLYEGRFSYETAESAEEAWEFLNELEQEGGAVAIILSDWSMPKVRGDEFLIQVHQKHPEIIKILLTGHADRDAVSRAKKEANLVACIEKPWTESSITAAIALGIESTNAQH